MNFVFFSPHFPKNSTDFCFNLKKSGAHTFGIGDAEYGALHEKLRASLTEYYRVSHMEDYGQLVRAVGYFTHKYGKIDRFESLNEHWLETDARIRTDFNIEGVKTDFIENLKRKSKMKEFFTRSGVRTIRVASCKHKETAEQFIKEAGYPVVVKPDFGSGANLTYKITGPDEFEHFFTNKPSDIDFIVEEYIDGIILTFDGLVDRHGNVRFAASHEFDQSIMEVVNTDDHLFYICLKGISPEVETAGRNILRSFDVRERFFHIELFKSRIDGEIIALEVNMRPPGAWMTDAINFSYDTDIYREWANMVVNDKVKPQPLGKYFTAYASRKDRKKYVNNHEKILEAYSDRIVKHSAVELVFSRAMGNYAYQFRSPDMDDVREFISFVHEQE
jgi:ATP-grasp domain